MTNMQSKVSNVRDKALDTGISSYWLDVVGDDLPRGVEVDTYGVSPTIEGGSLTLAEVDCEGNVLTSKKITKDDITSTLDSLKKGNKDYVRLYSKLDEQKISSKDADEFMQSLYFGDILYYN